MSREYIGEAIGCRFRITLEEFPKASFSDLRKPADLAAMYPNLRPCKLQDWKWIYRKSCNYCQYAVLKDGGPDGREETDNKPYQGNPSQVPGLQHDQQRGQTVPRQPVPPVGVPIRKEPIPLRQGSVRGTEEEGRRTPQRVAQIPIR